MLRLNSGEKKKLTQFWKSKNTFYIWDLKQYTIFRAENVCNLKKRL